MVRVSDTTIHTHLWTDKTHQRDAKCRDTEQESEVRAFSVCRVIDHAVDHTPPAWDVVERDHRTGAGTIDRGKRSDARLVGFVVNFRAEFDDVLLRRTGFKRVYETAEHHGQGPTLCPRFDSERDVKLFLQHIRIAATSDIAYSD